MLANAIIKVVSYTTASVVLFVGIGILSGIILPAAFHENSFRIILGSMMIIYGSYRIILMFLKQRSDKKQSYEDKQDV